jgi:hypothetical protein
MNPNRSEQDSKEASEHLVYINSIKSIDLPDWIKEAAQDFYGNSHRLNDIVVLLCKTVSEMTEDELTNIVYNGRVRQSRNLANWWETHQRADKRRIEKEEKDKKRKALIESARSKLTPEEIKVLNVDKRK